MLTKVLAVYSALLTTALAALFWAGSVSAKSDDFDQINVHRVNVREANGTLRMVIANRDLLPGVIAQGKESRKIDRPYAGMLFYNDEGNENGGLVFGGHRNEKGEVIDSGGSLTFDPYGGSGQIVQLAGVDDSANHIVGLTLWDNKVPRSRRVVVADDKDGTSRISLNDGSGKPRIVLQVAPDGTPAIRFLDATGRMISEVGPKQ
jgi:hypothetical protein